MDTNFFYGMGAGIILYIIYVAIESFIIERRNWKKRVREIEEEQIKRRIQDWHEEGKK